MRALHIQEACETRQSVSRQRRFVCGVTYQLHTSGSAHTTSAGYNAHVQQDQETTVTILGELRARLERLSAKRGVSISELAAEALARLVEEDDGRYSAARERAIERLRNAPSLDLGGVTWTRDELHER